MAGTSSRRGPGDTIQAWHGTDCPVEQLGRSPVAERRVPVAANASAQPSENTSLAGPGTNAVASHGRSPDAVRRDATSPSAYAAMVT
jgi:hypothetical protein